MKAIFIFGLVLLAQASEISSKQAEIFFQNYEFKKALTSWRELNQKSPKNWNYVEHVADLELLLEGRSKAQETLRSFLNQEQKTLSPFQKQEVAKKIIALSEVFLKEEAQSNYLQAVSKTKLKEWNASQAPVTQAAALEPDNVKILSLKYEIEKNLGLHDQAYESLKALQNIDTLSTKTRERLAESHFFHGRFSEAKLLLEQIDKSALSARSRLALAASMWELGEKDEAQEIVDQISLNKRLELSQHPVIFWLQYKKLADEPSESKAAQAALKLFLKASAEPERVLIDGWDPYRISYHRTTLTK